MQFLEKKVLLYIGQVTRSGHRDIKESLGNNVMQLWENVIDVIKELFLTLKYFIYILECFRGN